MNTSDARPHDGPFAGLETVTDALARLQTERDSRDRDRRSYRSFQNELVELRSQRALLDATPEQCTDPSLLSAWQELTAARRHRRDLTTREGRTPRWRRGRVHRMLLVARRAERDADEIFHTQRGRLQQRLDTSITHAHQHLARHPAPEPFGARDHALADAIAWLHWEINVGHAHQPTIEALDHRCRDLADDRRHGWTRDHDIAYRAVTAELHERLRQRSQARTPPD